MHVELDIGCPPGWLVHDHPGAGVALAFTGPAPTASGLPPTITVAVEPADGRELSDLRDSRRSEVRCLLTGARVEDDGLTDLAGRRAAHLRLTHSVGGHVLAAELWTWLHRELAWTVTASVDRDLRDEHAALFRHVAGSWRDGSTGFG